MILLASLRSDEWTAWSEHVDDFIGPRNKSTDRVVQVVARFAKALDFKVLPVLFGILGAVLLGTFGLGQTVGAVAGTVVGVALGAGAGWLLASLGFFVRLVFAVYGAFLGGLPFAAIGLIIAAIFGEPWTGALIGAIAGGALGALGGAILCPIRSE